MAKKKICARSDSRTSGAEAFAEALDKVGGDPLTMKDVVRGILIRDPVSPACIKLVAKMRREVAKKVMRDQKRQLKAKRDSRRKRNVRRESSLSKVFVRPGAFGDEPCVENDAIITAARDKKAKQRSRKLLK